MLNNGQRLAYKPKTPGETEDDMLLALVEKLQSMSTEKPLANLNQTTIADNNGSRIYL